MRPARALRAHITAVVTPATCQADVRRGIGGCEWAASGSAGPESPRAIAVQNHVLFGERLLIDGAVVDRGRARLNVTLRGTIEAGAGAGERITAQTKATFSSFSCRLVAESFRG